MTWTPRDAGWIEVICGSMFSGKTVELIRRVRRAQIAKMNTIIFKPKVDDRFSPEHIVSHNQMKLNSQIVETADEILTKSHSKSGSVLIGQKNILLSKEKQPTTTINQFNGTIKEIIPISIYPMVLYPKWNTCGKPNNKP